MESPLTGNWNFPTTIWFGQNRLQDLAKACQLLNIKQPLLVTDPQLAKLDFVQQALDITAQKNIKTTVFQDLKSNPTATNVQDGIALCQKHNCDGVIAIGGGSAIDCAKTIALLPEQSGSLWEFEDIGDNFQKIDAQKILPLIAIPTTSGTGSEVGRAALIVDEERQQKRFFFHPQMIPNVVIADPIVTLSLPPSLTAASAMDALTHNLEAFCAPGFHPIIDGLSLEGLRLIKNNLESAYKDGQNITARSQLMAASIMGGCAMQKGLGAVHSLSHPVGAIYDLHHGLLNAIFIPYVLQFNKPVIDERMTHLARYLELKNPSFDAALKWLIALSETLNISLNLSDYSVDQQHVDTIAEQAVADPSTATNPKPINKTDFALLLNNALTHNLAE